MELLFIYLLTIIVSLIMMGNVLTRIIKDIGLSGYLLKFEDNNNEDKTDDNPELSKKILLSLFTPGINIAFAMKLGSEYIKERSLFLDSLNVMNLLIEMTEEEKEKYSKKPTFFNFMKLAITKESNDLANEFNLNDKKFTFAKENPKIDNNIRKQNERSYNLLYLDDDNKIFFETDENLANLTIISATGAFANLSIEKQETLVYKSIEATLKNYLSSYDDFLKGTFAEFNNSLKENKAVIFIKDLDNEKDIKQESNNNTHKLTLKK